MFPYFSKKNMGTEISIHNLTKSYPNGAKALKGIDLEIKKGKFFTLLGPNGAGKSTLIKIVTTLSQKDSGEFLIGGINPESESAKIQNYIGIASQDNELDPSGKVEDLLVFQGRLFGLSKAEAFSRAQELISLFHLSNEKDKKTSALSGGNKRKLHCALALVHHPKVLFLDEPTVGMDPLARANFWEVITQLNKTQNATVFLTTQYLDEADKYANEMALIIEGQLHYSGTIAGFKEFVNLSASMSLNDSYLHYIKSISKQNTTNDEKR